MQAKDVIRHSVGMADMMMGKYLEDLDDSAFLVKPVPGMNHIAWQVGHLIASQTSVLEKIKPGSCPPLPEGFAEMHSQKTGPTLDPSVFHTKAEYLALWKAQREALKNLVESLTEEELDAAAPESLRAMVPTVGLALNLMGGVHPLMHVGQFVAVRRQLQMPVAM